MPCIQSVNAGTSRHRTRGGKTVGVATAGTPPNAFALSDDDLSLVFKAWDKGREAAHAWPFACQKRAAAVDDSVTVYVLALLPEGRGQGSYSTRAGWVDSLLNFAIEHLQPGSPVYAHVELLIPSAGKPGIFATYHGCSGARWWHPHGAACDYYLNDTADRWRALPLRVPAADAQLIAAFASQCTGAPYSIARYLTSARLLRPMSAFLSDRPKSPGHCATLVARALRSAPTTAASIGRAAAWYAPSSLVACVQRTIVAATPRSPDSAQSTIRAVAGSGVGQCASALLRGSDRDLAAMSDAQHTAALGQLTDVVYMAVHEVERDTAEADLARALLRSRLLVRHPPPRLAV